MEIMWQAAGKYQQMSNITFLYFNVFPFKLFINLHIYFVQWTSLIYQNKLFDVVIFMGLPIASHKTDNSRDKWNYQPHMLPSMR